MQNKFELFSNYAPAGDQPKAIEKLTQGLNDGLNYQTLLGVTGSGKTFTMANIIANMQKPTMVLVHNKTLAAQLYGEFKHFFPKNAVEYFVSYYDYYQPEAYVPASDTYIAKDASVNDHIEQMRISATKSLLEREDTLVVATVSAIYGLGEPETYLKMILHLQRGDKIDQRQILQRLVEMQYRRNEIDFNRSTFRVRGDVVDVYPAEEEDLALRIELFDDEIDRLILFDPLTGKSIKEVARYTVYPKSHYVTDRQTVLDAIDAIQIELKDRVNFLIENNQLVAAERLAERTKYDIEMMREVGYCTGIENYSRYLSGKAIGEAPPTLFDYLPDDSILFIDESHVTVPQIGAMYKGDRSRKENLVEYGFRLPSALDNRPLRFDEWEKLAPQMIFVSATPSKYEEEHQDQIVEQVVRPTGLLDPLIQVKPAHNQVEDLFGEVNTYIEQGHRILVTTLTKRMAEDLAEYFDEAGIKARYMHSDIGTVERVEIIQDLRSGVFDVLIGINLLREGLDLPEVALVAILDADKEGFLRSEMSLIQTIGRAARNKDGRAILYADKITKSMQKAIDETQRRREKQIKFNEEHNIIPQSVTRILDDVLETGTDYASKNKSKQNENKNKISKATNKKKSFSEPKNMQEYATLVKKIEKLMYKAAKDLDFETAASYRDDLIELRKYRVNF